uniref:UDP-glucuronosyltransferase n=1 Tax=Lygus hesperus TaxID=30085 RepID=A0A0K8STQ8_LYGHE
MSPTLTYFIARALWLPDYVQPYWKGRSSSIKSAWIFLKSNESYDAVMTEFTLGNEPAAYLAHKFEAVSILFTGFPDHPWVNELAGLTDNPSYMVSYYSTMMGKLNFWQRLYNTYITTSILLATYYDLWVTHQELADRVMRYEGWHNRPKLADMMGETALFLINTHPSTGLPYPKAPHVKEISGMHIEASPTLPKDLQEFMDDASHGVIYFSLGSVNDPAEMLKDGKFDAFLNVFRQLKQKVMWKVAPGMPDVQDPNIRLQTWYPQQAILAHENLKLFITHGGLQSMIEAIAHGVPVLGIPGFFDQLKNVAFMEHVGMGLSLTTDNITEKTVSRSINELLNNPTYREQAKIRQSLFKDRPKKPVDEAVYWIEYVLRHGNILRPASASMPFYQVYLLDVITTVILVSLIMLWVTKQVLKAVFSMLRRTKKGEISLKKKLN